MANEAARTTAASHLTEALQVLVLHTLDQAGPLNGYRIASMLERFDAPFDLPTLYAAILRQKQRGLIDVTFERENGRQVRTYALTARGRRYLASATVAWRQSASLLGGLLEEQDRQRRELVLAREVQAHFLPSLARAAGLGLDIAGRYRPAREIGGDYYDVIRLSDTTLAFALGDVAGKGIPAALLMATLRALVRSQASNSERLAADMSRLNDLLHESCTSNRFASLFYAIYDVNAPDLVYVNAGHPAPIVVSPDNGTVPIPLRHGGPVLGLLPGRSYEWGRVPFDAGSTLVAFSDGFTEACNPAGLDWGDERLAAAACTARGRASDALADHVMGVVTRFVADGPQMDDMTLLVVRRTDDALRR